MRRSILGGKSYKTDKFGKAVCEDGKAEQSKRKAKQDAFSGKFPLHYFRDKPKSGSPF